MKSTLIRLLLFVVFLLLFTYVIHTGEIALLAAFVGTWILEPLVSAKI